MALQTSTMNDRDPGRDTLEIIILVVLLFFVPAGDSAFTLAIDAAGRRDYSTIPINEVRVGYCIAASMPAHEKAVVAESIERPPDDPRLRALLRHSAFNFGDNSRQEALEAIAERHALRMRAQGFLVYAAFQCGYDEVQWQEGVSPLALGEKWLRYDTTFQFLLHRLNGAPPDKAIQLYQRLAARSQPATD